jgi:hypothetical protein
VLKVGQKSLNNEIIIAIYLLSAMAKVIYITASQLNNKGDVKDSKNNKIIDMSL